MATGLEVTLVSISASRLGPAPPLEAVPAVERTFVVFAALPMFLSEVKTDFVGDRGSVALKSSKW